MRKRPVPPRRALTLIELLVTIGLVALGTTIAVRLFGMVVRTYREGDQSSRAMATQVQWLDTMRRDVWSARERYVFDGSQMSLVVDGVPVVWRLEGNTLIRQQADDRRQWSLKTRLRWSLASSVLFVSDGDANIPLANPAAEAVTP